MIPRTLQIKNFLSYGPEQQTISFGAHHLICFSGKNGHGKSALLDAMTWALWGSARKIANAAKADHHLIHLGQTEMCVLFDFQVDTEMYRVKRTYELVYGKPQTSLEFGMLRDDESYTPLTDKTIKSTQACITKTVGLDFETFTNSTFLRQGGANEFSKRSPKERKEIICSILGLGVYDELKKAAHEKAKELNIQKTTHTTLQEQRARELETRETVETQIDQLEKKHTACQKTLDVTVQKHAACLAQKEIIQKQIAQKELHKKQIVALQEQKETALKELHTVRTAWKKTHKTSLEHTDVHLTTQKKIMLEKALQTYEDTYKKSVLLKDEIATLKATTQTSLHTYELEKQKLEQELARSYEKLTSELQEYKKQQAQLNDEINGYKKTAQEYYANLNELKVAHKKKPEIEQQITQITKQFEKRKETHQRFITLGNVLRSEVMALSQKMKLAHNENDPSCPLCEQNLSAARKRFLHNKLSGTYHFTQHRYQRLKTIIPKLKQILLSQHEQLQTLQKQKEGFSATQLKIDHITKQHSEITQQISQKTERLTLIQIKEELATVSLQKITHQQQTLLQRPALSQLYATYTEQQKTLIAKTDVYKKIAYNQNAHETAKRELKKIETMLSAHTNKAQQHAWQHERMTRIAHLCTQIKGIKKEVYTHEQQISSYKECDIQLKSLNNKEAELQQTLQVKTKEKEQLLFEKGALIAQQKKLTVLKQEHETEKKSLEQLNAVLDDYLTIAHAAGKDGVQALLIEDALPELEHEANQLLSKLTDNQAHVMIESLRDLKKGGTQETLDIKISDAAGIRPYELFSGGEAFRIDFALRIALSKLLARRAGTSLQTLIIDEGFGSQDEDGLSHIMDALYKIQDDFAKVIIVSHLSSMKDQFPVHFVIQKHASGSLVHIKQQG